MVKSYIAQKPYDSTKKTRQMIRKTFLDLVDTMPFYRASVSAICREMGISRTAFYYHFDDLYGVLDSLIDEIIAASGIDEIFSSWDENVESLIDIPCKVAMDSIGYYVVVNQCQCVFTNSFVSGYTLDYIIMKEMQLVTEAIMRKTDMKRTEAEQLFRFSFSGMFNLAKSHNWDSISATDYPKDNIRMYNHIIKGEMEKVGRKCRHTNYDDVKHFVLEATSGFTKSDVIQGNPSIGKTSAENALRRLIQEGYIQKQGGGRSTYYITLEESRKKSDLK